MKKTIRINTTKRGIPAIWESGGGMTSGGSATIITKKDGSKPQAIYTPRGGHLSCGEHALVAVHEGFYTVNAGISRGVRSSATIERIISTSVKDIDGEKWEATAEVETVNTFSCGEWDKPLDEKFVPAVEAAFSKAGSHHCRSAYYIDYSEKSEVSEADKKRRNEEMHRQDDERAKLRQAKADREAKAKAEAEALSKAAKEVGLGARIEAANLRLSALGQRFVVLGESTFTWHGAPQLYTDKDVSWIENNVAHWENEKVEKERKRLAREAFQPKFEVFNPRVEAIGLSVEFTDENVRLGNDNCQVYSEEGLSSFVTNLDQKEREAAEVRAKTDAEVNYQKRKNEAVALNLPTDIRIWRRRGGRTNAGDGWVIGHDGGDRQNTGWTDPSSRRLHRYGEGEMIWEQVLPGEVVLAWSKSCSAAEHIFEIIHLPVEDLTEPQLERIKEIQDELESEWEGARGLASGLPSPPVGQGWELLKNKTAESKIGENSLGEAFGRVGL
jgi:hypothetical protein